MDDQKVRACPLQECRGRPRCAQCKMLDEMYPPQRNLSGRSDAPSDAEVAIPMARLIELEAAEHERDILRAENAALKSDLQYARDGLTKGRTRMREDNERLRAALRWIDGATAATPGLTDAELGRAMAAIGKKARDALGA